MFGARIVLKRAPNATKGPNTIHKKTKGVCVFGQIRQLVSDFGR
jgi:hypothetical protein